MVSTNMFTLTQALKGVFVDTKMTDDSNKTGPAFSELTQMEEFWQVVKLLSTESENILFLSDSI